MDWKKILNNVGASAVTAVGATLVSQAVSAISAKAPTINVVPKCNKYTPLALCGNRNCFYHAVDKQRLGIR